MKYKLLTVLTVLTITASAENNLNTKEDWQPDQIVEVDLSADQLSALILTSPSLKEKLTTLHLKRSPIETLPDLKDLQGLEVLAIDNNRPITIDPNHLPSSLKTLVLKNDTHHFSKPGITVVSYRGYELGTQHTITTSSPLKRQAA